LILVLDISRGQHDNDTQLDHEYTTRPILLLHLSPPRSVTSNGSHFTNFSIYSHTPISIRTLTISTHCHHSNKTNPFRSVFLCFSNPLFAEFRTKTMLLRTAAASSLSLFNPNAEPSRSVPVLANNASRLVVRAAKGSTNHRALTGVIFEPFEEVKKELDLVPTVPQASLARQKYVDESEAAVNEQIKLLFSLFLIGFISLCYCIVLIVVFGCSVEYNVSYVYHALFAYFDRDNVALRGLAK